jgi:hypothetical protein
MNITAVSDRKNNILQDTNQCWADPVFLQPPESGSKPTKDLNVTEKV